MFYSCFRVEQALSARREHMTKDGQIIYGGPDHYARLAATKQFRDLWLQAGPAPKHPDEEERRTVTLDELRQIIAVNRSEADANAAA